MKKRVLVAGIFHETNTFVEKATTSVDFEVFRGAMVSQSLDDVEGEIPVRLGGIPKMAGVPVFGILNLQRPTPKRLRIGDWVMVDWIFRP